MRMSVYLSVCLSVSISPELYTVHDLHQSLVHATYLWPWLCVSLARCDIHILTVVLL